MEFEDHEAFERWLKEQSREVCAVIATRTALRVWPFLAGRRFWKPGPDAKQSQEVVALLAAWAIIVSAPSNFPKLDIGEVAQRAASAVYDEAGFEDGTVLGAAIAAAANAAAHRTGRTNIAEPYLSASTAYSAAALDEDRAGQKGNFSDYDAVNAGTYAESWSADFSALSRDADFSAESLYRQPLWHEAGWPFGLSPDEIGETLLDDPRFGFFKRWYDGMVRGEPLDWGLQRRVALIPQEIWESGIDAVAPEIARIEGEYRTAATPRLVQRDGGLFDVERDVEIAQEPLDYACGQVDIALRAAIAANKGNGLADDSYETILIRLALDAHGESPSIVATSFWNACMSLDRTIGDIYPEDTSLIALKNTLYTSVETICGESDVVRDRVAKLAALQTRRYPSADERDELRKVPEAVSDMTTEAAQAELQEAVDIVADTDKPPRVWRARLVNWITTLGQGIDKGQKFEKRTNWLIKLASRIAGWFFDHSDDGTGE